MSARRKFKPYRFRKVYSRKPKSAPKYWLRGGGQSPIASLSDNNAVPLKSIGSLLGYLLAKGNK